MRSASAWLGQALRRILNQGRGSFSALAAVPEPVSLPLFAIGLAGLGLVLRNRRR